ncbi:hypothetical protein CONPUDRAFT_149534 [Coniophora puteana RWD-64-598 SS2]|uniref:Transmembrane protein n=1 Tax=Coniophora puteana (strain RWD-64-598) TaxID=741705 RepID=A0A5M3N178_CONPW|nr:uncharacterized protein CONPUDRAFT_149534 [Coniophora puteana RWD-64-598 SS2]EIW84655.1 hypothetical protein CONPUDRAFT_149534 [Coniophora puteana RWD-64-598 SS2]
MYTSAARSWLVWASTAALLAGWTRFALVGAQNSDVQCKPGNDWMHNSMGQDACVMASYLEMPCWGNNYTVQALTPSSNTFYGGLSKADETPCDCNTIIYALYAACGVCQNDTSDSWSDFSKNCSQTYWQSYPETIPQGTVIPPWAFLPVVNDGWDQNAAKQNATAVVTSPSSAAGATGTGKPTSSNKGHSSSSNTGAIVGGVVGGVAGLAIIGGLVFFLLRRRRARSGGKSVGTSGASLFSGRTGTNSGAVTPFTAGHSGGSQGYGQQPEMGMAHPQPSYANSGLGAEPKLYNPDDPSTFPTSQTPAPSTVHTTQTPYGHPGFGNEHQPPQPGGYTGAPEI